MHEPKFVRAIHYLLQKLQLHTKIYQLQEVMPEKVVYRPYALTGDQLAILKQPLD